MKKFEAEALAPNGEHRWLCFLAPSQEAAHQKIRERNLTLCQIREVPCSPARHIPQKVSAKKFEAVASDHLGREVILSFLAPSEDAARQLLQQRHLVIRHICELPWSPPKRIPSKKTIKPSSIPTSPHQYIEMKITQDRKSLAFVVRKPIEPSKISDGLLLWSAPIIFAVLGGTGKAGMIANMLLWLLLASQISWIHTRFGLFWRCLKKAFKQEKIILTREKLIKQVSYMGIRLQEKQYFISDITNVRHFPESTGFNELLFFHYRKLPVMLWRDADREFIQSLTTSISDTFRFSCQSVERIVFGTPSEIPGPEIDTLHNPDVVELTVPFIRLREICIDPQTYDFHLVERFLTYALNHIGSETLKSRVEVSVYGELQELHPNIRNNLTHLCRCVRESGKKWLAEDRIEHG